MRFKCHQNLQRSSRWIREQSRFLIPIGPRCFSFYIPKSLARSHHFSPSQSSDHRFRASSKALTMAATMATSAKCMSLSPPPKSLNPSKPISSKPLISLPNPPKPTISLAATSSAVAGAVFSVLSSSDPAFAVQQIADLAAEGSDNRGLALLLPIVPAIGWVLFNILQPALNQLNRMRSSKGFAVGLGLGGGLAASGLLLTAPPEASAAVDEIAAVAEAASGGDNRGQLLLFVVAPALLWVAYNILQPALNQLNRMRSD